MVDGTLAPLPIKQDLEPIYKILLTPAVKNISHDNGTAVDIKNVIDTAISYGYIDYCSLFKCDFPACPSIVRLGGLIYYELHNFKLHGQIVYQNQVDENYLFYQKSNTSWVVSSNLDVQSSILRTTSCPQQGRFFFETKSSSLPIPDVSDWKECSSLCRQGKMCNYWQFYKNFCYLLNDFKDIKSASDDYLIGSKDCPGDTKVTQSPYGQCAGNMPSKSMWKVGDDSFFSKDYRLEPFDHTSILITGGMQLF